MSLGGLYLEGLIHGGAYFRNFTVRTFFTIVPPTFCYQSCAKGAFITSQIPFFSEAAVNSI